jgi:hypothetical protein
MQSHPDGAKEGEDGSIVLALAELGKTEEALSDELGVSLSSAYSGSKCREGAARKRAEA